MLIENLERAISKAMREFDRGIVTIDVQRLTGEQLPTMGLIGYIPDGETRVVAIAKNAEGETLKGKIMEGVDQNRFLHGEDEYYDSVLEQAKLLFNSR
jgi:hypothetical protein